MPEELIGEDGSPMNSRLHLAAHSLVECQLAVDEPKGIVAIAQQLAKLGISDHDIRHEIGRVATGQVWYMMKEGYVFDQKRYLLGLRGIVEFHR